MLPPLAVCVKGTLHQNIVQRHSQTRMLYSRIQEPPPPAPPFFWPLAELVKGVQVFKVTRA